MGLLTQKPSERKAIVTVIDFSEVMVLCLMTFSRSSCNEKGTILFSEGGSPMLDDVKMVTVTYDEDIHVLLHKLQLLKKRHPGLLVMFKNIAKHA